MKVIKAVHVNRGSGELESAVMVDNPFACMVYKPNVEVKARLRGSYIFSFDSVENALDFCRPMSGTELWEAKAPRARRAKWMSARMFSIRDMRVFWAAKKGGYQRKGMDRTPRGTMFSKTLTLTKKLGVVEYGELNRSGCIETQEEVGT